MATEAIIQYNGFRIVIPYLTFINNIIMITKFARLEFELFTKPSKSDFLRVHHFLGWTRSFIPHRIKALEIKGCIVAIDAMGWQDRIILTP